MEVGPNTRHIVDAKEIKFKDIYRIAGNFLRRKLLQKKKKKKKKIFTEKTLTDYSLASPKKCHAPKFHRGNFRE